MNCSTFQIGSGCSGPVRPNEEPVLHPLLGLRHDQGRQVAEEQGGGLGWAVPAAGRCSSICLVAPDFRSNDNQSNVTKVKQPAPVAGHQDCNNLNDQLLMVE